MAKMYQDGQLVWIKFCRIDSFLFVFVFFSKAWIQRTKIDMVFID